MVRNAVHNAFLNTLTTGTVFPRVPLEMTPDRGRHAKIFGRAKSAANGPTFYTQSRTYSLCHNIWIGDKQNHCVMCVEFTKERKTILHTRLLKFFK